MATRRIDYRLATPVLANPKRNRGSFASDAARLASPTLSGFDLGLGGAISRVVSYTYGPNGNVVSRTTVDSATGTTIDVRDSVTWPASDRINAQSQLLRRDVTSPDGTTATSRYTYDSAGNMTSKTDGTQTTSHAWDSRNRLVQVTLPDGTTEAYTYDADGLMLSSRKSTDTAATTCVWRGNDLVQDLVQETAPDGTVTRYNVVNGVLVSFERSGQTYGLGFLIRNLPAELEVPVSPDNRHKRFSASATRRSPSVAHYR